MHWSKARFAQDLAESVSYQCAGMSHDKRGKERSQRDASSTIWGHDAAMKEGPTNDGSIVFVIDDDSSLRAALK